MSSTSVTGLPSGPPVLEKKPVKFSNLLLGAGLNMFE
ncbi:Mitochondrial DNA replication protein YHM2 [Pyrenophora tritici-repentis]|nr:Mitochondrial DNA replication protein YHM2 [Pyrenophora tritici-repentis]KAI2485098.1 Mitochondrial DNA replication protein YHM2 [Pyrenophora tritici-repentis]